MKKANKKKKITFHSGEPLLLKGVVFVVQETYSDYCDKLILKRYKQ